MKLAEILTQLKQPIPSELISQKSIKGQAIPYVAWFDLAEILDQRCGLGNWYWEVKNVSHIGENLILTASLSIEGDDRRITMMATGCGSINCSSYGDPSSNAEAMAFRRCAAKFGLGRDLWKKGKPRYSNQQKPQQKGTISREEWLQL